MEDDSQLIAQINAEMAHLTLQEQLRIAIDLLDSCPPMPVIYWRMMTDALEKRGEIDSAAVVAVVLLVRVAISRKGMAA